MMTRWAQHRWRYGAFPDDRNASYKLSEEHHSDISVTPLTNRQTSAEYTTPQQMKFRKQTCSDKVPAEVTIVV